ncbi:MAG: hypothetical protein Q8M92_01215 [Candidatus Subteraquimicrobiales bacterium]|nr:hypothetical protein [Candidatus Subteraquimicrobiales bacterium]
MGTRCQIGIYKARNSEISEPESIIFKMNDGYVENTLPALLKFAKDMGLIDEDADYRLLQDYEAIDAWLKYYLVNDFLNAIKKYMRKTPSMKHLYTLKEIYSTKGFYQDIEFYYAFYPDRIESYDVGYNEVGQYFHKINTVRFKYELVEAIG